MKKLQPKQVPQFAALCILSAGTFGYFVVRLVTPSPAAAGTHAAATAASPAPAASQAAAKPKQPTDTRALAAPVAPVPPVTPDGAAAPPPTAEMRDPFVVGYVDPKTSPATIAPLSVPLPAKTIKPVQMASLPSLPPASVGGPSVPPLPAGLTDFRVRPTEIAPLPAPKAPALPPPAPAWTVTGVLQGDTGQVAILRNGEARRIVRAGDSVDGVYKVVGVTRSAVLLRHGKTFYQLTLGAAKASAAPSAPAMLLKPLAPASSAPTPALPGPLSSIPAAFRHTRRPGVSLAQASRSLIRMARTFARTGQQTLLPPALEHVRRTNQPQASLRFLDDQVPAESQTPQDTGEAPDGTPAAPQTPAAPENDVTAPSEAEEPAK